MLRPEINEYLQDLDRKQSGFPLHHVATKIREVIKNKDVRSMEDDAEIFAFNVYIDDGEKTSWNSYFGPLMSVPNPDGSPNDYPSRDLITNEILEYWEQRFRETHHPLLKSRYADLLIEGAKRSVRRLER